MSSKLQTLQLLCFFLIYFTRASLILRKEEDFNIQDIIRWLPIHPSEAADSVLINGFSWKNCGKPGAVLQLKDLELSPDPIQLPGNVTISASAKLKKALRSPIEVSVNMQKKMLFWIHVPCIGHVGSCRYKDICEHLKKVACPPVFRRYHIPCHCPFRAGRYKLPESTVPVAFRPSHIEKGAYRLKATVKQEGEELGCIYLEFSVE